MNGVRMDEWLSAMDNFKSSRNPHYKSRDVARIVEIVRRELNIPITTSEAADVWEWHSSKFGCSWKMFLDEEVVLAFTDFVRRFNEKKEG